MRARTREFTGQEVAALLSAAATCFVAPGHEEKKGALLTAGMKLAEHAGTCFMALCDVCRKALLREPGNGACGYCGRVVALSEAEVGGDGEKLYHPACWKIVSHEGEPTR